MGDEAYKAWLRDLEDAACDAEDLLDEIAIELSMRPEENRIKEMASSSVLGPVVPAGMKVTTDKNILQTCSLMDEHPIFGREEDALKILRMQKVVASFGELELLLNVLRISATEGVILINTRSHASLSTASEKNTYYLKPLLDKDCWALLAELALKNIVADEAKNLVSIGQEIAKKMPRFALGS
ncbi:hypothetical protein Scep_003980 [Stephania cephalantha]|uniref:Disease resistance N-terminal domain-containing protein n=1 Tax=Stephania cephalantha TaxID=152367 RepID=A0AAP0PYK6_9MAGN